MLRVELIFLITEKTSEYLNRVQKSVELVKCPIVFESEVI